jgi:GTP-binding protein SAR1
MNFIGNLFTSFFRMFGLFKKDAKIIFVGLDDAGKTSLMSVLKYGSIRQYDPTIHAHAEEIEIGKMKVHSVDLGGHKTVRKVWRDYFPKIDAIIYLIDAANPARFEESRIEFQGIIETQDIGDVPILILGNKVDKVRLKNLKPIIFLLNFGFFPKKIVLTVKNTAVSE